MKIALDAMGGDFAPRNMLAGARMALADYTSITTLYLVGDAARLKSDTDSWMGMRRDVLRRTEGSFLIAKRLVLLDQTVLLSRNLSTMF